MNQVSLHFKSKTERYLFPAKWEEIPQELWNDIAPWLMSKDTSYVRTMLVSFLLISKRNKIPIDSRKLKRLEPSQIMELHGLMNWIYETPITAPPFQKFYHGGEEYLLPNEMLKYISLIEYAYVDFCFNSYIDAAKSGNQELASENLDKVVCYLCRPEDPRLNTLDPNTFKGDRREQFNTAVCDLRLDKFKFVPIPVKLAVIMFFAGCKKRIHEDWKGIWPQRTEEGSLPIGTREAMPHEWINLCFQLAGGKFGTLEQTMYTDLSLILFELSLQAQTTTV